MQLGKVATDAFLLLAAQLRDGRTPNAARKQWFMSDSDSDSTPLIPLLDYALTANDVPMTLTGLDPVHPTFALLKSAPAAAKTPAERNATRLHMERWRWLPRDPGGG